MRMVFAFLLSILLHQTLAWGHEAPENTAAIVQRERSLDIRLSVDMIAWMEAVTPLPLQGLRPEDIVPRLEWAKQNLLQAKLLLNHDAVPLELTHFPSALEVVAMEHQHQKGSHTFATLFLRATLPAEAYGKLSLQLPPELGSVIMSFSRPESRWVKANAPGIFQLDRQSEEVWFASKFYWGLPILGLAGLLGLTTGRLRRQG